MFFKSECATTRPFVVETFSVYGRIKAKYSINSINDHFLLDDFINTSLSVSERSKLA
jgi:hypothetical protein